MQVGEFWLGILADFELSSLEFDIKEQYSPPPMETYVTQIGREELIRQITDFIGRMPLDEAIEGYREAIYGSAEKILSGLPEAIYSSNVVAIRCKAPAKEAVSEFVHKNDYKAVQIENILTNICREINFILYREYIEKMIDKICKYCLTHEPPDQWGLGSVQHFDREGWSLPFYAFWRSKIEKEGDEFFHKRVVEFLPENWRVCCKTQIKEKKRVCPYIWPKMSGRQIARALVTLKTGHKGPDKKSWGIGSIGDWEGEDGEPWGKSFYLWWRKKMDGRGSSAKFRRMVKPHLPEKWQANFERWNTDRSSVGG